MSSTRRCCGGCGAETTPWERLPGSASIAEVRCVATPTTPAMCRARTAGACASISAGGFRCHPSGRNASGLHFTCDWRSSRPIWTCVPTCIASARARRCGTRSIASKPARRTRAGASSFAACVVAWNASAVELRRAGAWLAVANVSGHGGDDRRPLRAFCGAIGKAVMAGQGPPYVADAVKRDANRSRSRFFCTLPIVLRGSSGNTSSAFGCL